VIRLLGNQLIDKPCRVYAGDFRVRVRATGLTTYPDAAVICDKVQFDAADPKRTTALNPKVLVEVTSPSTEKSDRGDKLDHEKKIVALKEVVLLAHDQRLIEVVRTSGTRWTHLLYRDTAQIASFECSLALDEVYRNPLL
jgi:Uma2 family endonuclease